MQNSTAIKKAIKLFHEQPLGKAKNEIGEKIKQLLSEQGVSANCFRPSFNYYHYR